MRKKEETGDEKKFRKKLYFILQRLIAKFSRKLGIHRLFNKPRFNSGARDIAWKIIKVFDKKRVNYTVIRLTIEEEIEYRTCRKKKHFG